MKKSFLKFLSTFNLPILGKLDDEKIIAIQKIDSQKIYLQDVTKIFNVSLWTAKILCNMAVKDGKFIKKTEIVNSKEITYYQLNNEINEDKNLLHYYMLGFNDELNGTSTIMLDDELENKAYNLGSLHALVGDDCKSIDSLTNEEILKTINNEKQ